MYEVASAGVIYP